MKYLFDTDAVSILYDGRREPFHSQLHELIARFDDTTEIQVSVLTLCELEYSLANAPIEKASAIRSTLASVRRDFDEIIPIDSTIAPIYGAMKTWLKRTRKLDRPSMRLHNIDLLIASTAMATSSVIVGMDRMYRQLRKFDGSLQVLDRWTST